MLIFPFRRELDNVIKLAFGAYIILLGSTNVSYIYILVKGWELSSELKLAKGDMHIHVLKSKQKNTGNSRIQIE